MRFKLFISAILFFVGITAFAQSPHDAQLYGMTQYGGPDHKGSIFHFIPATRTFTIDHDFAVTVKGVKPKSAVVTGNNGKYYGTTTLGGTYNMGVIFEWDSTTSAYTELYSFNGTDGQSPRGGMVLYNGLFYGMTDSGGTNNMGVIYQWNPTTNAYSKQVDMDSITGKNPDGSLTLTSNLFIGFTRNGGVNNQGVIFEWNPSGNTYTKQYDFDSTTGSHPVGKLVAFGGRFYGMANAGGANNLGVIYEWNYTTHTYTRKIDFNGLNGQYPTGSLTLYNSKFYGMTYEGGAYETNSPYDHFGVIFEWNPATNAYVKKKDMGDSKNTVTHGPLGSLTLKGNVFWGVTSEGVGVGAIFSWNPATNVFSDWFLNRLSPFSNRSGCDEYRTAPGSNAYESLLLSGDKLLGISSLGGGDGAGCLFEYYPDSNQITRAVHMLAADGKYPRGSLSRSGNKLYGVTMYGGHNHGGNIFEWDIKTQQYTQRIEFSGYKTGTTPKGTLALVNGKYYGINTYGNSIKGGTWSFYSNRNYTEFFSWDPVTNHYQTLYNTTGETLTPTSPTVFNNKLLLPMFKAAVDSVTKTDSYLSLWQFNTANNTFTGRAIIAGGSASVNYQDNESANALTYYNGKYYGMTSGKWVPGNGFSFKGTIYEWDTTLNRGIPRLDLKDTISGTYPTGDLMLLDTVFYGLTTGSASGGAYGNGLFQWSPQTNKSKLLLQSGANGTPTYSRSKIYYLAGDPATAVVEYDPVLDTAYYYYLPTYPGAGQPYSWYSFLCHDNSYPKLLEVVPNEEPRLSNIPLAQIACSNQNGSATFTISDMDNDTMRFNINSSNTALLPVYGISITNSDSIYTLHYIPSANQSGTVTISISANDGYGGSVAFSFIIQVQPTINTSVTQAGNQLQANNATATGYQWLDCGNSNTPITGATNQTYTAPGNGSYALVIAKNACSDTSNCYDIISVGTNTLPGNGLIAVYPNPCLDELIVDANVPVYHISLLNMLGQIVLTKQPPVINTQGIDVIDVRHLPEGIYFVKIKTTCGEAIRKVVKK